MTDATGIKVSRDVGGITLRFVRPRPLKQVVPIVKPMTRDELEYEVLRVAGVNVVAIQESSIPASGSVQRRRSRVKHSFLGTALEAWSDHRDFIVKPDHFWLMFLQAVGIHVNNNSKALRKRWVRHKGKMELRVRRDGFIKDSRDNDWAGVVEEFVNLIDAKTVDNVGTLLDGGFSTTTFVERIAAKSTVMNIVKSYFDFVVMTLCGFPSVRMEGSVEDWEKLRDKVEEVFEKKKLMPEFSRKWSEVLLPVLDKLVLSAKGEPPLDFWDKMIKYHGPKGSGGYSYVSGWINVFLPIVNETENPMCFSPSHGQGPNPPGRSFAVGNIPNGLCTTPIVWKYLAQRINLELAAGFVGAAETDEDALMPEIGWVLVRTK